MDEKVPKISIVMPFYNCEKYLDEALQSVVSQTFTDFECILINDASTDNSDDVVRNYLKDQRIVYIKNDKNLSHVKNYNKGILLAKAPVIARMDGDDVMDVQRLEKQYNFLQENPEYSLVGSFIKVVDSDNKKIINKINKPIEDEAIRKSLFYYLTIVHATVLIKKNVFEEVGLYDDRYDYTEDLELFHRIVFSGYKAYNLPEYLYYYRYHDNNAFRKKSKRQALNNFLIRKESIKKYSLNVGWKGYFYMYFLFIVKYFFPPVVMLFFSKIYKKYFSGLK